MPAAVDPVRWRRLLLRTVRTLLVALGVLVLLAMIDPPPKHLGLTGGKLAPCPGSPNSVSSAATDPRHAIAPFILERSAGAAKEELKQAAVKMPRAKLISEADHYLHFEFRSLIFRFVDDVEFQLDEGTKTIQLRSASRVGYWDLGVNRRRVERFRALLPKDMQGRPPEPAP